MKFKNSKKMSIKDLIQKQKNTDSPKKNRVNIEAKVNANRVSKEKQANPEKQAAPEEKAVPEKKD